MKNVTTADALQKQLEQLIVHWPLYRKYEVGGHFLHKDVGQSPPKVYIQLPQEIRMDCEACCHKQPWDIHSPHRGQAAADMLCNTRYDCRACHASKYYWLYMEFDDEGGIVTKVGQVPALELQPPPLIAAGMEKDDLRLYRHALTCRHSSFGIAAVAYLRRIVENRTNFLIDLIAARLQEEEPSSALLLQVEEIKIDRRYSRKIEFAADMLPKSVRVGGQNPVSALHDLTSEALHGLSDEESVDVFDRCQLAFEHVIKRLRQDQDEDQSFKEALKKLAKRAETKQSGK